MCAKFRGIPALIYSGLWRRQIFDRLKKDFQEPFKFVVYITDQPPAIMINIHNGNFEMEKLDHVKEISELEEIDCDGYFAAPQSYVFGGPSTLMKGIEEQKVKMKNESAFFSSILRVMS
ncbi:MAG: hypothetical protein KGD58_05590 [Candidatus Lokiarchaeota archaeon]|nr:hypothetical protein [Candidatus Lokiarchaeota archaeon]